MGVVSFKKMAVAPLTYELFRRLDAIHNDIEGDVSDRLNLQDVLRDNLLGLVVDGL